MDKLRIFGIVMSILLWVCSASGADVDTEFSGVPWGAERSSVDGLVEASRSDNVAYYTKKGEAFSLPSTNLGPVLYGFYQNRLFAGFVYLESLADFDRVMDQLKKRYGKPKAQLRLTRSIYIWDRRPVKIKLKHYESDNTYKLAYYYTPLSTQLNESRLDEGFEKAFKLGR